jgi:type IV secretory pathway TraG/TraD family ATPase VirD4
MILKFFENRVCEPRLNDDASVLLKFPTGAELVIKNTYEGYAQIGSIGSGKTSAALSLQLPMLRHGYGILICCVKSDEAAHWEEVAAMAGRSHDFIRFCPGSGHRFNPFDGATNPSEAVNLLQELMEVINGDQGGGSNALFWKSEGGKVMLHAFTIVLHAVGRIDWIDALRVIRDHASSLDQVESQAWRERSHTFKSVQEALAKFPHNGEVQRSSEFWLRTFPAYDPRTRANVLAVTANLLEHFQSEPLRSSFSGDSTCGPLDILTRQKIICVDFPVLQNRLMGLIANSIWNFCTCRVATEKNRHRPAAIYIDEAQFLLTEETMRMQTVIRSHSVATILLFQNLPVLRARMSQAAVAGLLGSMNTIVFSRQADSETRQWAADRIGKKRTIRETRNRGSSYGRGAGGSSSSVSKEEIWDYKFHPDEFSNLKTGGRENGYKVGTIVLHGDQAFRAKWHQIKPGSWGTVQPKY